MTDPVSRDKLNNLVRGWAKLSAANLRSIGDTLSGPADLYMLSSKRSFLTSSGLVENPLNRKLLSISWLCTKCVQIHPGYW